MAPVDMMECDQVDFDEEPGEEIPDDEDAEMDDSFLITPRVALSEIFESLAGEKTSPVRPARRSTGWSFDELGGDGLCLGDVFA